MDKNTQLESFNCPYFNDGRIATFNIINKSHLTEKSFDTFLSKGFRRTGSVIYSTICKSCQECIPIRINTNNFISTKSQKRTYKKNNDINVTVNFPPVLNNEKIELYKKYLETKHDSKPDENTDFLIMGLFYGYFNTIEVEYKLNNKLIAVSILDVSKNGVSSNYFYYDTKYLDRRLGVFSIIKEIEISKNMGKNYYYLGYYIEKNQKMSYKKDYGPAEILENNRWKLFTPEK